MLTLAFDTSSNILSTSLLLDQKVLSKNIILENSRQSELLVVELEKILKENQIWYQDLDLIATTNGPGSFTGVRIGLTVARAIKIATKKPLILVNSCEAIAYKYKKFSGKIITILDAKMNEVFIAEFLVQNEILRTLKEPQLVKLEELEEFLPKSEFLLCGSGKDLAQQFLTKNIIFEDSKDILEADLVGLLAYDKFQKQQLTTNYNPLYLRMPKIEERKK